jgi:hypothetical protein
MQSKSDISDAKALLANLLRSRPWYSGIGIGRVSSTIGLVVSVKKGARANAEKLLEEVDVGCPVDIREVSVIRPRKTRATR